MAISCFKFQISKYCYRQKNFFLTFEVRHCKYSRCLLFRSHQVCVWRNGSIKNKFCKLKALTPMKTRHNILISSSRNSLYILRGYRTTKWQNWTILCNKWTCLKRSSSPWVCFLSRYFNIWQRNEEEMLIWGDIYFNVEEVTQFRFGQSHSANESVYYLHYGGGGGPRDS